MSQRISALLQVEQQLQKAQSREQLFYSAVNDLRQLVDYDQAILIAGRRLDSCKVRACSDVAVVDRTAPFISWVERLSSEQNRKTDALQLEPMTAENVSPELGKEWPDFSPKHLLWIPLVIPGGTGRQQGALLLFRQREFSANERALLGHVARTLALAWFAQEKERTWLKLIKWWKKKSIGRWLFIAFVVAMFIPVRLSVLAPAEVVPKDPVVIASPLNGAIRSVLVEPNQTVNENEALAQFEDSELRSEVEIAERALNVVQSQLRTIQQSGFVDPRQRSRVAELETEVRLKESELEFARLRLNKSVVRSPEAGIVVINDPSVWRGRPVSIGERIMLIANQERVRLRIMVPVKDALVLEPGNQVRMFFDTDPMRPVTAIIQHASYEPEMTPEGTMAYRVIADFESPAKTPRIGLRGTARLYSERTLLFYYIFRRPITAARQWIGW